MGLCYDLPGYDFGDTSNDDSVSAYDCVRVALLLYCLESGLDPATKIVAFTMVVQASQPAYPYMVPVVLR